MKVEHTSIAGLLILTPQRFEDERGFFCESWNKSQMADIGVHTNFVQDNHSLSKTVGTIRGLHFQSPPRAQDKLVRCGKGAFWDVAVDIRKGSPTYGSWVGVELSFENGKQLLVPKGFLHGFVTREANTEIIYKCSDYYTAEHDGAVRFDCQMIGIDWGMDGISPILSAKDSAAGTLSDFDSPFLWEE